MKLYNLYTDIILENIKLGIRLIEGVSGNLVDTVLAGDNETPGKHYRVAIRYKNQKGEVSNQFIEINQKNVSSAGNGLIYARVLSKNNVVLGDDVYKKFRLDGIEDFKITKVSYRKPGSKMRTDGGNDSKSVSDVSNYATYDYEYAPSTIKQKAAKVAGVQNVPSEPMNAVPSTAIPTSVPKPKQIVRPMKRVEPAKPIVKTATSGIINNPQLEPTEIGSEEEEEEILNTN
jgi:hypothetical protein